MASINWSKNAEAFKEKDKAQMEQSQLFEGSVAFSTQHMKMKVFVEDPEQAERNLTGAGDT